jgi:hypothetical protein
MIEELKKIIKDQRFKQLLDSPELWQSKDVDYHPPRVERVWLPINDMRLSLHVIHPCEDGDSLLHPHPWESAMYVLPIGGLYEHQIGFKRETEPDVFVNTIVCKQIVEGAMYYEMMNPNGIHSVRPLLQPVFSIMLSGKPIWTENFGTIGKNLVSLSDERKKEILLTFKNYFE